MLFRQKPDRTVLFSNPWYLLKYVLWPIKTQVSLYSTHSHQQDIQIDDTQNYNKSLHHNTDTNSNNNNKINKCVLSRKQNFKLTQFEKLWIL